MSTGAALAAAEAEAVAALADIGPALVAAAPSGGLAACWQAVAPNKTASTAGMVHPYDIDAVTLRLRFPFLVARGDRPVQEVTAPWGRALGTIAEIVPGVLARVQGAHVGASVFPFDLALGD